MVPQTHKQKLFSVSTTRSIACALCFIVIVTAVVGISSRGEAAATPTQARLVIDGQEMAPSLTRVAQRLQKRLRSHYDLDVALPVLARAVDQSRELFRRSLHVEFQSDDGTAFSPLVASLHVYPTWLRAELNRNFRFHLDLERIRESVNAHAAEQWTLPSGATIAETFDDRGVLRVRTDGIAKPGYVLEDGVAEALQNALLAGETAKTFAVRLAPGTLANASSTNLGKLELLAMGKSDFAGSGLGRKNNVRKGLNDHLHNTVVAPGETFSFNATLYGMRDAGWQEALGIFNGNELRPVRGGGICQVATTLYRSLIQAGLPVVQRKNHSLFVEYYAKHGIGIDATIYPGQQDLTFLNDTGNFLVIQSYAEGEEAFVNIYGTHDGRSVVLKGPYFTANAPADLLIQGRAIRHNEIAWMQTIHMADRSERRNVIHSRYQSVPKSVVAKYMPQPSQGDLAAMAQ